MNLSIYKEIKLARLELQIYICKYRRLIILGDMERITDFEIELENKFIIYEKLFKDSCCDKSFACK